MKVLQVHNYYQLAGGEDSVVANEKALLEAHGDEVISFHKHNKEIEEYSTLKKLGLINRASWSEESYHEILDVLLKEQPDVCHVHNFLPLISPSVYYACKKANIPVVQTLHNYRIICTNGLFLRNGKVCENCLGKSAYHSVSKKCYRNSYAQTFTVARMIEKNNKKGTWTNMVDAYICFTDFAKSKFIAHGLPENKIYIKPNFVDINLHSSQKKENYFVYVGRLENNKGVRIFKEIGESLPFPLKVIGEGDLLHELENIPNVELLGKKTHTETLHLIQGAKALVLPSLCYEGMPMTILEAFASKTPVIASNMGAMQTMIDHKKNGLLFTPNSFKELTNCFQYITAQTNHVQQIVDNAYADYQHMYSKNSNYKLLIDIYQKAITQNSK